MKQKLYVLDAFFVEKLKLSEKYPHMFTGVKQAKMADRSLSQEKQGPKKTVFSILMAIYDVNM